MEKRVIPIFATEAEEAEWWYEHREEVTQDLIEAVRSGRNGIGTRGRLRQLNEQRAKEQAANPSRRGERLVASVK